MWNSTLKIILVVSLLCVGCKESNDNLAANSISIGYLKSLYKGYPLEIVNDYVMNVRVISSDMWANFNNSIIIGDVSGALEMKIAVPNLHEIYNVGQLIKIRCNGLVLGDYGGTLQLGSVSNDDKYECGFINADQLGKHIIVEGYDLQKIYPKTVTIPDLCAKNIGCFVRFTDVQFVKEELELTWGSSEAYTKRHLEFGDIGDTLTIQTSSFASFASTHLPQGSGLIDGIIQQFNGQYYLKMISDDYLLMNNKRF